MKDCTRAAGESVRTPILLKPDQTANLTRIIDGAIQSAQFSDPLTRRFMMGLVCGSAGIPPDQGWDIAKLYGQSQGVLV